MAKDLHLPHIEELAATGDVQLVKTIFNKVLNKLTGVVEKEVQATEKEINGTKKVSIKSITEKVDGVPLLFGKIGDEFFVGLKNRCLKNGKFVRSAAFFSPSDFSKAGGNAGLIENLYNNLKGVVSENTVYFGELIFSTHEKDESDERKNKNQTLQKAGDGIYATQPNLLWYKIKGVSETDKLGILQIGTFKNVLTDSDLVENKIEYGKFDFTSNNIFLTTGEVDLVIDSQNETVTSIQELVNKFKFSATKNFKIKDYVSTQYTTGQYKDVSKAKELLLDLISTVRTVLGYKTVTETGKTGKDDVKVEFKDKDKVDEGVVVSTGEYKVKFISKNFFEYTVLGHYDKSKDKKTMSNESAEQESTKQEGVDLTSLQPNILMPVVLFKGKFQPFHSGHYSVFKKLKTTWDQTQVYIVTSEKNEVGDKLLKGAFKDKKAIIELYEGTKGFLINDDGKGRPYKPETAVKILENKTPVTAVQYSDKTKKNFVTVVWAVGQKDANRLKNGNTLQVDSPEDLKQKLKDKTTKNGKGLPLDVHTTFWTLVPTLTLKDSENKPISATDVRSVGWITDGNKLNPELKKFFDDKVLEKLERSAVAQRALETIISEPTKVVKQKPTKKSSIGKKSKPHKFTKQLKEIVNATS